MEDKDKKEVKEAWWQSAMSIGVQITGWIATPIIIALFLGKWLDEKYNTEPWLFLGTMLSAFIITSVGIARVSISYIKKIEKEVSLKKGEVEQSSKSENKSSARNEVEAVPDKKLDNND